MFINDKLSFIENKLLINMDKWKLNIHKLIERLFFLFLIGLILYWPIKFAKYHLFDLSYQEVLEFSWRTDGCQLSYPDVCPCPSFIEPDDHFTITDDGDLYFENKLYGKLILKDKPSFFHDHSEILSGGFMEIIRSDSGVICYYDSI
ncbi:hypothetical protein [Gilliamella apis]|uniref:hypothetical protein n=1 Tax=Gilliamella apis TaxID=1970738 RepID=UPI0027423B14|nr:hypothetical protein [Gilliamella apis]WLT07112.1 hypothetical protein RAM11_03020 [Gilliamella apis]